MNNGGKADRSQFMEVSLSLITFGRPGVREQLIELLNRVRRAAGKNILQPFE